MTETQKQEKPKKPEVTEVNVLLEHGEKKDGRSNGTLYIHAVVNGKVEVYRAERSYKDSEVSVAGSKGKGVINFEAPRHFEKVTNKDELKNFFEKSDDFTDVTGQATNINPDFVAGLHNRNKIDDTKLIGGAAAVAALGGIVWAATRHGGKDQSQPGAQDKDDRPFWKKAIDKVGSGIGLVAGAVTAAFVAALAIDKASEKWIIKNDPHSRDLITNKVNQAVMGVAHAVGRNP